MCKCSLTSEEFSDLCPNKIWPEINTVVSLNSVVVGTSVDFHYMAV